MGSSPIDLVKKKVVLLLFFSPLSYNSAMKFKLFSQYKGLRKEIYVLFFGRVVTSLGSMIWSVLTLIMNQKLHMSATAISLYMIASGAVMMPVNFIGGKLADKYNKKNIIVICDLFSIVMFIVCGFLPISFTTLIVLTCGSLFQTIEGPAYNSLVADLTLTKDRESAYSLLYLGMNLGLIGAPTLAGLLFKNYLWLSFIISGVAIGLSTLMIYINLKDITPVEDNSDEAVYQQADEKATLGQILKENKVIILFIIASAFYSAAYSEYSFLMPIDMGKIHGDTGALIYGTVSSLNCFIVVAFTPLITTFFEKMTHTVKMVVGCCLLLVGYSVFLIGLGFIPSYYIAMFLFTLGEIFSTISYGPYQTSRIPASHRGRLNGVFTMIQGPLQGILMFVTGRIYDVHGTSPAWTLVLLVLVVAILMKIVLVFADKKRYPQLYLKHD